MSILSNAASWTFSAGNGARLKIPPSCRWLGAVTSRSNSKISLIKSKLAYLPGADCHSGSLYFSPMLSPQRLTFTQEKRYATSQARRFPKSKKESNVLANEKLIATIMRKHRNTPPAEVMVRLVIDEGPEHPADVSVVSLADAINVSVDRMTDLIGTSLQSDPPVIRATNISKLEYRQQQIQQKGNAKSKKQKKTFRFRAGISDHDLERKLSGLIKFLDKGLECDYSVFSKARMLRVNPDAGTDLVERIQDLLADHAQLKRPPQLNGSFVRVNLIPKKNGKVQG